MFHTDHGVSAESSPSTEEATIPLLFASVDRRLFRERQELVACQMLNQNSPNQGEAIGGIW
jgi:hypothetical protein